MVTFWDGESKVVAMVWRAVAVVVGRLLGWRRVEVDMERGRSGSGGWMGVSRSSVVVDSGVGQGGDMVAAWVVPCGKAFGG